jgi:hypothetical protein
MIFAEVIILRVGSIKPIVKEILGVFANSPHDAWSTMIDAVREDYPKAQYDVIFDFIY